MKVLLAGLTATVCAAWGIIDQPNASIGIPYFLMTLAFLTLGWFSSEVDRWRLIGGLMAGVPVCAALHASQVMLNHGRVATLIPLGNLLVLGWSLCVSSLLLGIGSRFLCGMVAQSRRVKIARWAPIAPWWSRSKV